MKNKYMCAWCIRARVYVCCKKQKCFYMLYIFSQCRNIHYYFLFSVSAFKTQGVKRQTLQCTALFKKRLQFFVKKKLNYIFPVSSTFFTKLFLVFGFSHTFCLNHLELDTNLCLFRKVT